MSPRRALLTYVALATLALLMWGLLIAHAFNNDLTCPPNYAAEYTSSGHKFCRLVLPACKESP